MHAFISNREDCLASTKKFDTLQRSLIKRDRCKRLRNLESTYCYTLSMDVGIGGGGCRRGQERTGGKIYSKGTKDMTSTSYLNLLHDNDLFNGAYELNLKAFSYEVGYPTQVRSRL